LQVNADSYELDKIADVQVRVLSWKDHLLNMVLLGVITSSILFVFIPTEEQGKGVTLLLPAMGFVVGAIMALAASAKYEFRLEFKHGDETGVQWITAAKSRSSSDYAVFKERKIELKRTIS
jgi:hypothetical protein